MGKMIEATGFAVALAGGVDQGEIARVSISVESALDGSCQVLGMRAPNKPATGDGCAVGNLSDGLFSCSKLNWHASWSPAFRRLKAANKESIDLVNAVIIRRSSPSRAA